jgi:hypothetical protein
MMSNTYATRKGYGNDEFVNGFVESDELPDDADDSGYRQAGRQLWFSASDPDAIFIRSDETVERWPRAKCPAAYDEPAQITHDRSVIQHP